MPAAIRTLASIAAASYALAAYALFLATTVYALGFTGLIPVPKSIDTGPQRPPGQAILVDLLLLLLFAVQHSAMARPGFKRWWTRAVPPALERATYVLFASLALDLLFWQWQPVGGRLWHVADPAGRIVLHGIAWAGWGIVLLSTFMISHFELFGLRQVYDHLRMRAPALARFRTPLLYRLVRHPIYLGFLMAFWSTPDMGWSRALFAGATTVYVLIGIQLEERDLIGLFGERYRQYRTAVPMLLPWRGKGTPGPT